MEPFSMVAFVLGAAICGIIGNRADKTFCDVMTTFTGYLRQAGPPVNHDLQRAVRKAYLQATLAVCNAYLKILGVKTGLLDWALSAVVCPSVEVRWADAVQKWIRDELHQLPSAKYIPPSNQAEPQVELLLRPTGKAADQRIEDLHIGLKEGLLSELKQHHGNPPAGFEKMINEGWNDPALENGPIRLEWFDLLCAFFAECVKTNERVRSILESKLLSDLTIKVETIENIHFPLDGIQLEFRKLGKEMVKKLEELDAHVLSLRTEQAERFGSIEGKLDEILPLLVLIPGIAAQQQMLVSIFEKEAERTRIAVKEEGERILTFLDQRFMELQNASVERERSREAEIEKLKEALRVKSESSVKATPEPIPIPLPKLQGIFVDRQGECDTLRKMLLRDKMPMVIIAGPGGYGKTELINAILKETAPSGKIADPNVQGILYLRCHPNDLSFLGRIFSEAGLIVGKSEEFRKIYARNDFNIERKTEFFLKELNKAGNVWLVMDKLDEILTTEDEFTDPELRQFIEIIAATEHCIRLIFSSRAMPRFQGNQRMKRVYLDTGLPEAQAIEYLRTVGADCGLADEDNKLLVDFVKRVQGIPKALECVIGYLLEKYPEIQLSGIMGDVKLFADFDSYDVEKGLKWLIAEQFAQQSSDAQLLLCGLSIFTKPVPLVALQSILPALDMISVLARLERNKLVSKQNNLYDLNPLVREHAYTQIPEKTEDTKGIAFTRSSLHSHAADFFAGIRLPAEHWKTISDIEPQLDEIDHRIRAGHNEEALKLINLIDFDYLQPWGYSRMAIGSREQLLGGLVDEHLEGSNLLGLGKDYLQVGRLREAVTCLEKALKIALNSGDVEGNGEMLLNLSVAYYDLGETSKAIECEEQALKIFQDNGDEENEGVTLNNMGVSYYNLGNTQKAIEFYEAALKVSHKIGDPRTEARSLANLGGVYEEIIGKTSKALEYHEQALKIFREIGDLQREGVALNELGNFYQIIGEANKAISYHEQALKIHRERSDQLEQGRTLNYLGADYEKLGNFHKAIELHEQAFKIHHEIGALPDEGLVLFDLGDSYQALGETSKAIEYYEKSLEICRKTGDPPGEIISLRYIGNAFCDLKKPEEAIECYEQALKLLRETSDRDGEAICLNNLGYTYVILGDMPKAIEFYEQSLEIYRDIGNRAGEKWVLNDLGRAYEDLGETKKATECYERASEIQNKNEDRQNE